jgi:hypothetical protein
MVFRLSLFRRSGHCEYSKKKEIPFFHSYNEVVDCIIKNPQFIYAYICINDIQRILVELTQTKTVSSIASFFLAMTLYPEAQRKAQEEIDRVVGTTRLPTFNDRPNLPYVDALVKEVLRWNPIAPMGVPHTSIKDDICEGYFIPKGSMVLPNIWYDNLFT